MSDLHAPRTPGHVNPIRPGLDRAGQSMAPRTRPARPDSNPMRLMLGLVGIASASALTAAMLPSIAPYGSAATTTTTGGDPAIALAPQPSVIHVTRVVQLAPGQTAPPNASVQVKPQPTPRVTVKVVTQQSGKP